MTKKLYELIECAFSISAFEEAIIEEIGDAIDYREVAQIFLDNCNADIQEAAAEVAQGLY